MLDLNIIELLDYIYLDMVTKDTITKRKEITVKIK